MKYERLAPISLEEVETALAGSSPIEAATAILRMAMHDSDHVWAERKCLSALMDQREEVRAAAITALGHLARIHRELSKEIVVPALEKIKQNDSRLAGFAEDALEDIAIFTQKSRR